MTRTRGVMREGRRVHPGHELHHDPHHRGRPRRLPGRARPLPARRRARLPVGEPRDHRAAPARPGGRAVDGPVRPDPRRAQLDVRPRPGRIDPVLGIERLQEAYFARFPGYERGITVPAIVDVPTGQVVTNDFAQITLDLSTQWRAVPPRGRARPLPGGAAGGDRRGQRAWSTATSTTASTGAASPARRRRTTQAYDRLFDRLDWLSDRLADAALPGRRHDHRGRRAAVHDAGPLRRRSTTATSSATGRS